jgi:hypothetical protein
MPNAAAAYPGSLKIFAIHQDVTDVVFAANVNDAQTEIVAVQTILGVNPQIGSTFSGAFITTATNNFGSVNARLNNLEAGMVGDAHNQYIHKSGGDTITQSTVAVVPITVNSLASPTANLQEWRVNGTLVARIDPAGNVLATNVALTSAAAQTNASNTFSVGPQILQTGAVGNKAIVLQASAGATANILEASVGGTLVTRFDSNGNIFAPNETLTGTLSVGSTLSVTGASTIAGLTATTGTFSGALSAGNSTLGNITSSGVVTVRTSTNGYINLQSGGAGTSGYAEFVSPGGVRQGYVGFSSTTSAADTGTINYIAGAHVFTGTLNTTGNLSENGNRVYSLGNPPPAGASAPVQSVFGRIGAVVGTATDIGGGTFPAAAFTFPSGSTLTSQNPTGAIANPVSQFKQGANGSTAQTNANAAAAWVFLDGVADTVNSPRLAFNLSGVAITQLGMDRAGVVRTYDSPGTGYAPFAAGNITAASVTAASITDTSVGMSINDLVALNFMEVSS